MKPTIVAIVTLAAAVAAVAAISATAAAPQQANNKRVKARAVLVDTAGNTVGKVVFKLARGKTSVDVRASGLTPGFHGFHVHTIGACDGSGGFASAGGHWNPSSSNHAAHAGDMTPLLVGADGTAEASFLTDRFAPADLLDADGSAVIVHAGPDNFANIPTRYHSHTPDASSAIFGPDATTLSNGDSGARAACGLVRER
jgi:superoxide dismutase, Cu-Zn family